MLGETLFFMALNLSCLTLVRQLTLHLDQSLNLDLIVTPPTLCSCFRLASMAPLLACRVLPNIEVTMGYERDENTRWGNWPNTNMVQAVKSMGARHNGREPYISFQSFPFMRHISLKSQYLFIYDDTYARETLSTVIYEALILTISFTKPMWTRRTRW